MKGKLGAEPRLPKGKICTPEEEDALTRNTAVAAASRLEEGPEETLLPAMERGGMGRMPESQAKRHHRLLQPTGSQILQWEK